MFHNPIKYKFNSLYPEYLNKDVTEREIISCVSDLTLYKNQQIGGALKVYNLYNNIYKPLQEYLNSYDYLSDNVKTFIMKYIDTIEGFLDHDKYLNMYYFAVSTLINQHLFKIDDNVIEIPAYLYLRCAIDGINVCNSCFDSSEIHCVDNCIDKVKDMYERLSDNLIVPSTPSLLYSGTKHGRPTSCVVLQIGSSIESFTSTYKKYLDYSSNGAGVAIDITNVPIYSTDTKTVSSGILPVMIMIDTALNLFNNRKGRRGAAKVSIRDFHYEFDKFIDAVDINNPEGKRITRLKTSIDISNCYMKKLHSNDSNRDWYRFCPSTVPELLTAYGDDYIRIYNSIVEEIQTNPEHKYIYKIVNIDEDYKNILNMQKLRGNPFISYGCNVNSKNNFKHICTSPSQNICMEMNLPIKADTYTGICNLASISLKYYVDDDGSFNFLKLANNAQKIVEYINNYSSASNIEESQKLTRSIGIGVCGFSDMVSKMKIDIHDLERIPLKDGTFGNLTSDNIDYSEYGRANRKPSRELIEHNRKVWSCLYYNALLSSIEQVKVHGKAEGFEGSPLSKGIFNFDQFHQETLNNKHERTYINLHEPYEPVTWGQEGSWSYLRKRVMEEGVSNLMLLSVQPTATTAQVSNCSEAAEFYTANIYKRVVFAGEYTTFNEMLFKELEDSDIYTFKILENIINNNGSVLHISEDMVPSDKIVKLRNIKENYMTMYEMSPRIYLDLAITRQPFICHSQSLNIYTHNANNNTLKRIHKYTWENGLKTGMYYLRTLPKVKPYNFTLLDDKNFNAEHSKKRSLEVMECSILNKDECTMCSS